MRKIQFIGVCLILLTIAGCTNHNSINIIIANTRQTDLYNTQVRVSLKTICHNLGIINMEEPILLNEKNNAVDYQLNATKDSIMFTVPIIHRNSQKTYSINKERPTLSNGFLRIRGENIRINK
jgi:hypothetical protein